MASFSSSSSNGSSSWYVAQLPRLLMATASILLEWLFRIRQQQRQPHPVVSSSQSASTTMRDRAMVQVLLWLTASLPSSTSIAVVTAATNNNNNDPSSNNAIPPFDVLLHSIFFVNLLAIVIPPLFLFNFASPWNNRSDRSSTFLLGMCSCWRACCYCPCYHRPSASSASSSYSVQQPHQGQYATDIQGQETSAPRQQEFSCFKLLNVLMGHAALSLWVTLVWAYFDHSNADRNLEGYLELAGIVWFVICLVTRLKRFHRQTRQSQQQQQQQWPTSYGQVVDVAIGDDDHHRLYHLDEAKWHTWTVPQVTQWLAHNMEFNTLRCDNSSNLLDTAILPRLAWEGVDGPALQFLDRDALRHMDVPYGIAAPLLDRVQNRLVQRYPIVRQRRRRGHQHAGDANDDYQDDTELGWTLEDQGSYFDRPTAASSSMSARESKTGASNSSDAYNIGEDELAQIRASMKERYGFELPDLASPVGATVAATPTTPYRDEDEIVQHKNQSAFSSRNASEAYNHQRAPSHTTDTNDDDYTVANAAVDPLALESMPPHVRQIVQQNPQMWQQVQATQMATPSKEANASNSAVRPMLTTAPIMSTTKITPELLQSLPPGVKEVALRNPGVFLKMLQSKTNQQQQRQQQQDVDEQALRPATTRFNHTNLARVAEEGDDNHELVQLLPKKKSQTSRRRGHHHDKDED